MVDNDYLDPLYFPSQAWFSRYEKTINDDDEYNEMSEGWGVEFDGDIIFEMTNMPVDDLDTAAMPEYLRDELDQYMTETGDGYTGFAYLGLEDGRCTGSDLITGPDTVDTGFHLTAHTEDWEELLRGDTDIIRGLMSGSFELDGNMQKILQYSNSAQRLTSLAASRKATALRPSFPRPSSLSSRNTPSRGRAASTSRTTSSIPRTTSPIDSNRGIHKHSLEMRRTATSCSTCTTNSTSTTSCSPR